MLSVDWSQCKSNKHQNSFLNGRLQSDSLQHQKYNHHNVPAFAWKRRCLRTKKIQRKMQIASPTHPWYFHFKQSPFGILTLMAQIDYAFNIRKVLYVDIRSVRALQMRTNRINDQITFHYRIRVHQQEDWSIAWFIQIQFLAKSFAFRTRAYTRSQSPTTYTTATVFCVRRHECDLSFVSIFLAGTRIRRNFF